MQPDWPVLAAALALALAMLAPYAYVSALQPSSRAASPAGARRRDLSEALSSNTPNVLAGLLLPAAVIAGPASAAHCRLPSGTAR